MVNPNETNRVIAIVQARMGSTRLPGKVMADAGGRPMLGLLVARLRQTPGLAELLVATSDRESDDPIAKYCASERIPCFRGSESDVLDRFHGAARGLGASVLVRITADCPLVCPEIVGELIRAYRESGAEYGVTSPQHAEGLDCEIFSAGALDAAWREAKKPSEREHVTPFIAADPARFRRITLASARDDSGYRITVDEPRDLDAVRAVVAGFGDGIDRATWSQIREFLDAHPEVRGLNADIERNEGYRKSLEAERGG
jgi:spore coat polysaccharide biosynthesis protein SpsF (cytidylyltransferase family)